MEIQFGRSGDWILSDGTKWERIINSESINSVNGFIGNIVLTTSNIEPTSSRNYVTFDELSKLQELRPKSENDEIYYNKTEIDGIVQEQDVKINVLNNSIVYLSNELNTINTFNISSVIAENTLQDKQIGHRVLIVDEIIEDSTQPTEFGVYIFMDLTNQIVDDLNLDSNYLNIVDIQQGGVSIEIDPQEGNTFLRWEVPNNIITLKNEGTLILNNVGNWVSNQDEIVDTNETLRVDEIYNSSSFDELKYGEIINTSISQGVTGNTEIVSFYENLEKKSSLLKK